MDALGHPFILFFVIGKIYVLYRFWIKIFCNFSRKRILSRLTKESDKGILRR